MDTPDQAPNHDKPKVEKENLLSLPAEQIYQLERIRALEDTKSELIKWAKGRFWLITVVAVIGGALGGYNLIDATVRKLLEKEVDSAKKEMLTASIEARSAGAAAAQIIKQAEGYGTTVDGLTKKAGDADLQLATLKQKIQAETANTRALSLQEVKGITARLGTLETLVTNLAKESKDNTQLLSKYESEIKSLSSKAEAVSRRFLENANYNVIVGFNSRAEKLAEKVVLRLTDAGFKTSSTALSIAALPFLLKSTVPVSNSISYGSEAAGKIIEIQDLLRGLARFKEIKEFPSFAQPGVFAPDLTGSNTVRIILVDDK
jgi:hypothetical protein